MSRLCRVQVSVLSLIIAQLIGDELERLLHFLKAASHGSNVIWSCLSQMLGRRLAPATELNRKRPSLVSGL